MAIKKRLGAFLIMSGQKGLANLVVSSVAFIMMNMPAQNVALESKNIMAKIFMFHT